jgi:type VI secretion system protein ImpB
MGKESTQKKLSRVRPPRVHITYEVETGGAIQLKELPFVVGVLGDFSGKPAGEKPPMKDRKFIEVDRDSFNKVMNGMKPRLAFRVDNKLAEDDTKIGVELNFKKLDDFEPENVATQVEPLRKLLEARSRLSDLVRKLDGNEKLEGLLQDVIGNTETLRKVGAAAALKSKPGGNKESSNE